MKKINKFMLLYIPNEITFRYNNLLHTTICNLSLYFREYKKSLLYHNDKKKSCFNFIKLYPTARIFFILILLILITPVYHTSANIKWADTNISIDNTKESSINENREVSGVVLSPKNELEIPENFQGDKEHPFIVPNQLRLNIDFWKSVYSKYTTNDVIIHDSNNLDIIYEVLKISDMGNKKKLNIYSKAVKRKIKSEKRKYKKLLYRMYKKTRKKIPLTDEEKKIASFFDKVKGNNKFLIASRSIRAQLGQKDRFIEGIKRSGFYLKKMKEIFRSYDLPEELAALPHVESSFDYQVYSSAGAAGIWQFMRSTAREFMRVDYVVDERWDPLIATHGAAKLLRRNYNELKSWPMAITAYNHGLAGMKRAKRKVGANISDVINKYRSRIFGFASRNFYCEFIAALEISNNYKKYFGKVEFNSLVEYELFPISEFVSLYTISEYLNIDKETLIKLNPALRKPVLRSEKLIPKGYVLKIPLGKKGDVAELYATIPKNRFKKSQLRSDWYKIRKGDTISGIADKFKVRVSSLMEYNEIRNVHRIYAGQILKLPNGNKSKLKKNSIKLVSLNTKSGLGVRKEKKVVEKNRHKKVKIPGFSKDKYGVESAGLADNKKESEKYGYIIVEPEETIGHYSDWSDVSASKLRRLNGIRRGRAIVVGQKIKIYFNGVSKVKFEEKRAEYHLTLQEDFLASFKIDEIMDYRMERGDTVWELCSENNIPLWMLKRYNSGKDLSKLLAGDMLSIPIISKIN